VQTGRAADRATVSCAYGSWEFESPSHIRRRKVSKVRELRSQLSCGLPAEADVKLDHYRASLVMLERRLGERHTLVQQLRCELEMLGMLQRA
jgi:hypothetical protein